MSAIVPTKTQKSSHRQEKEARHVPVDGVCAIPVVEAFDRLGSSRGHVYPFIMSGELRTFTLGRRRFTTLEWLSDFMRRQESAESLRRSAGSAADSPAELATSVTIDDAPQPRSGTSATPPTPTRPRQRRPQRRPSKPKKK